MTTHMEHIEPRTLKMIIENTESWIRKHGRKSHIQSIVKQRTNSNAKREAINRLLDYI